MIVGTVSSPYLRNVKNTRQQAAHSCHSYMHLFMAFELYGAVGNQTSPVCFLFQPFHGQLQSQSITEWVTQILCYLHVSDSCYERASVPALLQIEQVGVQWLVWG